MRMSRMFGETLREAPAGIESAGHQFLLRAGYVRPARPGHLLLPPARLAGDACTSSRSFARRWPRSAASSSRLPVVHPAELWQQSGRYQAIGAELTRFQDRRDRDMVLAMTHEEVVASLAATRDHLLSPAPEARLPDPDQVARRPAPASRDDPGPGVHDEGLLHASISTRPVSTPSTGRTTRLTSGSSLVAACP